MVKSGGLLGFIVFLVFGAYLINMPFSFLTIPEFISKMDKWISFLAGALLIVGGFYYLKSSSSSHLR